MWNICSLPSCIVSPSTKRILLDIVAGFGDGLFWIFVNNIRDELLPRASNIPCTISSLPFAKLISVPVKLKV